MKIICRIFGHRWEPARPRWMVTREWSNGTIDVHVSKEPAQPDDPPSPTISAYPRCRTCGLWDMREVLA